MEVDTNYLPVATPIPEPYTKAWERETDLSSIEIADASVLFVRQSPQTYSCLDAGSGIEVVLGGDFGKRYSFYEVEIESPTEGSRVERAHANLSLYDRLLAYCSSIIPRTGESLFSDLQELVDHSKASKRGIDVEVSPRLSGDASSKFGAKQINALSGVELLWMELMQEDSNE